MRGPASGPALACERVVGLSDMNNTADNTAPTPSVSIGYAVLSTQSHGDYELASSYYELASLSNLKLVQLASRARLVHGWCTASARLVHGTRTLSP